MAAIEKKEIIKGIIWVEIPEAEVYLCCGCPADTVKHLKKAGLIQRLKGGDHVSETGPNALLLSDAMIQNGQLSNLTEFPVLQMLYLQGLNIPGHPNYQKARPILIGIEDHIKSQINYIYRGNYGLVSMDEIRSTGIDDDFARKIFEIKMQFAYGRISSPEELIDKRIVRNNRIEIKNGVYIERQSFNKYTISFRDERVEVDMNLGARDEYVAPFELPYGQYSTEYFSVLHTGEGNGWDVKRPCMASVLIYGGKIYLIDAGPNILDNLRHLGISVSEIEGIFQSHVHDDHFAGLTELIKADKKFKYFTTTLVRKTAEKKLAALMNMPEESFHYVFDHVDLTMGEWNDIQGMKVKPVYSPHPVETNIFFFKVTLGEKSKVYAHLSDTVGLDVYEKMIGECQSGLLTTEDLQSMRDQYLMPVDLKKVDVGGGNIHGNFRDYEKDASEKIIYAHTDEHNLWPASVNNFGSSDILLRNEAFDFYKQRALHFLQYYFPTDKTQYLDQLWNEEVKFFQPGERIVLKDGGDSNFYLTLSGVACGGDDRQNEVPAGTFIGYSDKYFRGVQQDFYKAVSFVSAMSISESVMGAFLQRYSSEFAVAKHFEYLDFLSKNPLFMGTVSRAVLNRICSSVERVVLKMNHSTSITEIEDLYIIHSGEAILNIDGMEMLRLKRNDHFGAAEILQRPPTPRQYEILIQKDALVFKIPHELIRSIPSVLWKVLEVNEKRNYICSLALYNKF